MTVEPRSCSLDQLAAVNPKAFDVKGPCRECPFRKESLPGWLGDYEPEALVAAVKGEVAFPCHVDVQERCPEGNVDPFDHAGDEVSSGPGYENPEWFAWFLARGKHCAGYLAFAANVRKRPRNRAATEATVRLQRSCGKAVFGTESELLDHHGAYQKDRKSKKKARR